MGQKFQYSGQGLVVNWHVTEACNYRCKYCYAHWDAPECPELIRDTVATEDLILSIRQGFDSTHANPLRLNFAGGEPLLFKKQVIAAMRFAVGLGLDVSLITNGTRLNQQVVSEIAPLIMVLGISVDAAVGSTNRQIGRLDTQGKTVSLQSLAYAIDFARQLNPLLTVKINTVVNGVNWNEDLSDVLETLKPDQWKVLQMLPSTTRSLEVSKKQFEDFVQRHQSWSHLMRVEDNEAMVESYLMVDPHGRFFQNGRAEFGYAYSAPILEVGAAKAVQSIAWAPVKFASRYGLRAEAVRR